MMLFEREHLADLILFTDSRMSRIRCASSMPYHKFHATLQNSDFGLGEDVNVREGMYIVKLPNGRLEAHENKDD